MSRAFVKEDDQEEPPFIPPRASLPSGTTNYVTLEGVRLLEEEKEKLEEEKSNLSAENDRELRHKKMLINGKLSLLNERLASAQILDHSDKKDKEVRFGAVVQLQMGNQKATQELKIVGVDEADIKKKKIAFVSPLAQAITGSKKGEKVQFKLGEEKRKVSVVDVHY